ncbi:DUF6788 family protein [Acaryochloris sp. CCMEE 5410]|uniref:DUF6788 family protein n=1 Tax=Acaryochloris sp. CCMEE 5410 TaxID=310037 RepID=UPI00024852B4|nr:DUF6788 family protein [Acaryochloris sp. CCMEE 5410]KAI9130194.1 hypothetical protein ON05_031715 [Acaryochloris sp. CCMEE 5410]
MPIGLTQLKPAIAKLSPNKKQRLLKWLQSEIEKDDLNTEVSPKAARKVKATYRHEYVRCGKDTCDCMSGNVEDMHGPYWYAYQLIDGRLVSKYIGKKFKELD